MTNNEVTRSNFEAETRKLMAKYKMGFQVEDKDIEEHFDLYSKELVHLHQQEMLKEKVTNDYMLASSLMITMSPLMVHRLEPDFPSMSSEVLGKLFEEIQSYMKPFQDQRTNLSSRG